MTEKRFTNRFSWSVSRDRVFDECPRKYYFMYYGSWSGWESEADERTRKLYVLKRLSTRATWAGSVVHDCIKQSLQNVSRRIPVLPVDEILDITLDRMRRDFRNSRAGRYWEDIRSFGLFEHEYALEIPDARWKETAAHVEHCLRTFYASDVWRTLARTDPDDFLEIEEYTEFPIDDERVLMRLDLALRETNHIVVWDWKTGRRESPASRFQMACYAACASQRYGVPVAHVKARRFELATGEVMKDSIGERELEEVISYIRGRIRDMKSLLDDPVANRATEERFAKVERPDTCGRCCFRKVCNPRVGPRD